MGLDADLPGILTSSYELKEMADYESGDIFGITASEAQEVIDDAERFVKEVYNVLMPMSQLPPSSSK